VTEIGDVGTRYFELALRMRRLEPDLVECYTGPDSLAEAIESEPPPTPSALHEDVVALRAAVDDAVAEPERRAWLAVQLDGLETGLRHLGGEHVPYRTLVRRCHGVDTKLRSYARRWMLEDDEFVDAFVESLSSDRWPAYESCYAESLPLCRRLVGGDLARFGRLLREQLTPGDLDGSP
jgi:hypothetical protein